MESAAWLPDAATPAVTDDTDADSPAPALHDNGSDAFAYSDDGSYSYHEADEYAPGGSQAPDATAGAVYQAAADTAAADAVPAYQPPAFQSPVPSYQAPVPPQVTPRPGTAGMMGSWVGSTEAAAAGAAGAGAGMAGARSPWAGGAAMAGASTPATGGGNSAYDVRPAAAQTGPPAAPRRANLVLARLEPWSVMKFSFLISLVAWVVLFVAVAVIYYFLSHLGVFDSIQQTLKSVTSSQGSSGVKLSSYISESKVLGYTMLLGAINVVIITALATIGAVIYNLVTHIGGGIEITLKESD